MVFTVRISRALRGPPGSACSLALSTFFLQVCVQRLSNLQKEER